ncbi:hypothetical protein QVD17_05723 [Tagetes erecta]|uniref:Kinesin motor domain-containing protein n=1 Tax=Tagetes erecta TaxID=13708 RepID=A0AAD8LI31_TARER|nr:hypothetical protein QVD17_05723 [Tagetes erecta]
MSRRSSGKNLKFDEIENVPVNSSIRESLIGRLSTDCYSRAPLNTIQEPLQNPSKHDNELGLKSSKTYRTPTKPKVRNQETGFKTPEKHGGLGRNRYGWGQDARDEARIGNANTPKPCRTLPRGNSGVVESNSTHTTPTKGVVKPVNLGLVYGGSSRPPVNGGVRTGNFAALSKGIPVAFNACTTVNTIEVPHFDLRDDPSFWMDHNVQVLIRIRPLNGMEIASQGYNRCLKQESAQSLTWVSQPETRFTFDHVACETIDQGTLFKMVGQPMVENCLSGYNSCMFAYGQTGSGKTHTMLGEINDLEIKPSPNRGMTPRIFEYLFARIMAEEESRKDERLKYSCKCSFLEIYNEQIADLLDPSSTNLQLREDVKKGVYVENLTEYEVHCVGDILKLLSQGSANRRVAATNMNRESSRSHSVFTCVIESRWEKDSTSNLRFARLNLVDLAGSERQKTSGAEGERLKEAANINKSLSTLGHVIMVLVDGANARTRHVPYRDSRLTFLLQDSLGGNSKTMIIANVSPSISSSIETLNTLKFAQRAKLIQNNAVINEDASGDVEALQHQIRLLKEELAILKRQNTSRSLIVSSKYENCSNESSTGDDDNFLRVSCNQMKSLESSLNGALRREKSTENCIKQLEAEVEQLNCLVRQREEENRCTKMMLKFREDKIQKMESVFSGLISADSYLIEENNTLTEEIKILRAKVDKNPEVTRFAVENIRLLEQLKRFQDFYEEGEREMLLAEVSELRDQLALVLDENNHIRLSKEKAAAEEKKEIVSLQSELIKTQEELEKCRANLNSCLEKNTKLCGEISELKALLEMQKSSPNDQDGGIEVMKESILDHSLIEDHSSHTVPEKDEIFKKYPEEIVGLHLELEFLKIILEEERLIHKETEEEFSLMTKTYEKCIWKEKQTQQELTLLKENCEKKDRNFYGLSEEFDLLTKRIEEVLAVGNNALDDASNFIGHGKQTSVCENLQIIARKISEKEVRIDELNTCLEDAKLRGNEMELMLRSLRGAILVMSEAHQKDCIEKEKEIDKLLSELKEKNSVIVLMEEQRKLYEVELMDAMKNTTQQALESCCYLHKFEEAQHKIEETDFMINNLVNENEAVNIEINELKRKEINYINERDTLKDACSVLENQLEADTMDMKRMVQVADEKDEVLRCLEEKLVTELSSKDIELFVMSSKLKQVAKMNNEKDEELRCLEQKLVTELASKDIELFVLSSKLKQVALVNNDIEEDKISMSKVFEKLKEERFISCVELQFKDSILMENDTEICLLQKEIKMQDGDLKLQQELENKGVELRFYKEENEKHMMISKNQKYEIEEFEACFESLEYDHCENFVKSLVLEAQLTENVEDALKELENKGAELRLYKEDNEKLVMISKNQKYEIEEFEACFESLVYDHYENVVKSLVLEAQLTEKVEDALKELENKGAELRLYKEENEKLVMISKNQKYEIEDALKELENKGAELRLYKEENEKLVMISKNQKYEIEEFEACFESLEYDQYENIVKSLVLEAQLTETCEDALKELENKGAELRFYKEENEKLLMIIKNQKYEIEEFEACFESLEYDRYENVVKSMVLEAQLTENVEYALKAKRSAEEQLADTKKAMEIIEAKTAFVENSLIESLKKDLDSVTCERDDLHVEFLKAKQLYEVELTNAKRKVQEADSLINKLVTENEALEIDISHQNQVINAKEIELFITLSRLEQVASDNNDLEKEKINFYLVFEKLKEDLIIFTVDLHFKDLILLEKDAEIGALQMVCESNKHYGEVKLKLYEKSVEELESTINLLENQVVMVKRDAESQRLKKEELEQEVQKIHLQKQLLATEKETFKTENANYKIKVIELEDEVKKLLEQQDLQQHILPLAKIKEENVVLKAQNDENCDMLRKAKVMVDRVKEEVANSRINRLTIA